MENQNHKEYPTAEHTKNDMVEIDLAEIFYLLWGHVLQIIVFLLLGAVVTFGFTYFFIAPKYQATARIYIVSASNNSVVNLSDLQIGASLTADYQELMLSRPLLEDVVENLDLDFDYATLESMISITNTADTRILKIVVTDTDAQRAADIANELVAQANIYLPQIMEMEEPNLVESAVAPTAKSSPSYSRNTIMGALLSAALYCGVLLAHYMMNDTFVTPDDIVRYFGVQPLGTIPEGHLELNAPGGGKNRKPTKEKKNR